MNYADMDGDVETDGGENMTEDDLNSRNDSIREIDDACDSRIVNDHRSTTVMDQVPASNTVSIQAIIGTDVESSDDDHVEYSNQLGDEDSISNSGCDLRETIMLVRGCFNGIPIDQVVKVATNDNISSGEVIKVIGYKPAYPYHEIGDVPTATKLPSEPKNPTEMFSQPEWYLWYEAMREEVETMEAMNVFEVVPRPVNSLVVKSGWVFNRKIDKSTNRVKRYRSRLVGKGYSQIYGEHYGNTWSPVARWDTLRCVLAFAASRRYVLRSCDIAKAFLNADLDYEIHMEQPEGFVNSKESVWLLNKAVL
jgi:hypothetical protein